MPEPLDRIIAAAGSRSWLPAGIRAFRRLHAARPGRIVVPPDGYVDGPGLMQVHPDPKLILVLAGRQRIAGGRRAQVVTAGDALAVPADRSYREWIPRGATEWTLLAMPMGAGCYFHLGESRPPLRFRQERALRLVAAHGALIGALIACQADDELPERQRRAAFDLLLDHLVAVAGRESGPATGGPPAVAACRERIARDHADPALSVAALAAGAGLSRQALARAFREHLGTGPQQCLLRARVQAAQRLLADGGLPVAAVARRCGFSSRRAFTRCFRRLAGVTPSRYRRMGHVRMVSRRGDDTP